MTARDETLRPRELVRRLRLDPSAVVADIGACVGFFTTHLADATPCGRVIATDVRGDRLSILERRLRALGLPHVETRVVAAGELGIAPSSVDLVFLCQLDQHVDDRVDLLESTVALLRPGGRIAVVNFARFRDRVESAGRAAALAVTDEWWPSPTHFLLVLAPQRGRDRIPGHARCTPSAR